MLDNHFMAGPLPESHFHGGRDHARRVSFQAAIWASRIAGVFGADIAELTMVRRAAKAHGYARCTLPTVAPRIKAPTGYASAVEVGIRFAGMLTPLFGEPMLPRAAILKLLETEDLAEREAAEALASTFGILEWHEREICPSAIPRLRKSLQSLARQRFRVVSGVA